MPPATRTSPAFSLVELSLVLAILGLLSGAILAGRNLVRAAELRSVSADFERYRAAGYAFRDKYIALPGDMKNAASVWGAQDGGDGLSTDCTDIASTTALTCNGDGNGRICGGGGFCPEMHRYWQHLANAGMIEGTFTGRGLYLPQHGGAYPGVNAPVLKISKTTFELRGFMETRTSDPDLFDGYYGNAYFFGASHNPAGDDPIYAALSGVEALGVDVKSDDAKPGLGKVRTFKGGTTSPYLAGVKDCASSAVPTAATYAASDVVQCALIMDAF